MGILLLLILLLLIFGAWPRGPEPVGYYSYGVPGGFGLLLVILLVILLLGHGPVVWW